jgi:hypothetical protein
MRPESLALSNSYHDFKFQSSHFFHMQKSCQKIVVDKIIFYLYTSENKLFFLLTVLVLSCILRPCAHARSVPEFGHFFCLNLQYTERKCSRQPLFLIKNKINSLKFLLN